MLFLYNEVKHIDILTLAVLGVSVFCISETHMEMAYTIQNYWTGLFIIFIIMLYALLLFKGRTILFPKKKILQTICLIGILEVVYGIVQLFGILPNNYRYAFFSGSLNNPAVFGMYLSFCIPITVFFSIQSRRKETVYWRFLSVFFSVFVVLSDSRTAILASLCGVFAVLLLKRKEFWKYFMERRSIRFAVVFFLLFGLVVLYLYKRDSADGRLLIWNVCWEMIKEKPLCGWGWDGLMAQYMNFQAVFFENHPNSPFALLAGETQMPFNEFIHVAVVFGIPSSLLFLSIIVWTLWYICNKQKENYVVMFSIVIVFFIWCLFSYPLNVPFVWLLILFVALSIAPPISNLRLSKFYGSIVFVLGFICFFLLLVNGKNEIRRLYLQEYALELPKDKMLEKYEIMYNNYSDDGLFLYNYAALLHLYGDYEKSILMFNKSSAYVNDYNMMLLMGDNYQQMDILDSALVYYRRASKMIPNRYLPLYYQMTVYQEKDDNYHAKKIAEMILCKKNKIGNSRTIHEIVKKANECLND